MIDSLGVCFILDEGEFWLFRGLLAHGEDGHLGSLSPCQPSAHLLVLSGVSLT